MTAATQAPTDARKNKFVGPDDEPDTFRLVRYVGRGGEGELWHAVDARADGRTVRPWALKIMHARDLTHGDDVSPLAELDDRYQRYIRSKRETDQLAMTVPGVVGAAEIFRGGEPHGAGEPAQRRTLYVVSPWVDGDDLATWRRAAKRSFEDLCTVVERLAAIVDGMATHAQNVVHRDISPGNVIVRTGGEVALIDFTFVRPPNTSAGTVAVHNGGYTAPEVDRRSAVGVAADRYSVGAVTHFLLTGVEPNIEDGAARSREVLRRRGFSPALADHVASMLATDPARRPHPLLDWAHALRGLGRPRAAGGGQVVVDLAVDGSGTPVVLAADHTGLATARLAPGVPRSPVRDPDSPPDLCTVAGVANGVGALVTAAVDDVGSLWLRRPQGWVDAGPVRPDTGVATTRVPSGGSVAFAVDPGESRLTCVAVDLDGTWRRTCRPEYADRVLAAGNAADGTSVVAVVAPGGGLVCVEATTTAVVTEHDAVAADLCLNTWGELLCVLVPDGSGTAEYVEQLSGAWGPSTPLEVPGQAAHVACVGTRTGVTIAVAGSAGVHLATLAPAGLSPWQQLTDRPGQQVALEVGAAWRIQLAAVVDQQVMVATEGFDDRWPALEPL